MHRYTLSCTTGVVELTATVIRVYYKQARYAQAARFENAVKMDPSRAIAYMNLGDAYAQAGQKDKARGAYTTYLELAPKASGAAYARQQLDKI